MYFVQPLPAHTSSGHACICKVFILLSFRESNLGVNEHAEWCPCGLPKLITRYSHMGSCGEKHMTKFTIIKIYLAIRDHPVGQNVSFVIVVECITRLSFVLYKHHQLLLQILLIFLVHTEVIWVFRHIYKCSKSTTCMCDVIKTELFLPCRIYLLFLSIIWNVSRAKQ